MYEMASGRRAFAGSSPAATLAAVINQEPKPLRETAPELPYELEKLVMRCLRKDIGARQQNMTDLKLLLEDLKQESESGRLPGAGATSAKRRKPILIMVAAFIVMTAVAGLWLGRGHEPEPPRVVPLTTFVGREDSPSFSPDGSQVVFAWNGEKQEKWDLYVKIIGSATALRLTTDAADNRFPAWSPDGKQIAFIKRGQRTGLYLISPLGGPEQKIADFDAADGPPAWSPDGKLLLVAKPYSQQTSTSGGGTVFVVPAGGGEPRPILVPDPGGSYLYPAFNSSSRSLAVATCKGVFLLRTCDVDTVSLNSEWLPQGKPRRLSPMSTYVSGLAWTADGRALVVGASTSPVSDFYLWLVESNSGVPKRLEIASQGASSPAVALKGRRLAFSRRIHDSDVWGLELGGPAVTIRPFLVSSTYDASAQFSPDGSRIAFASDRDGIMAIWLTQTNGSGLIKVSRGPENFNGSPRWSPDGRWVAFDARNTAGEWSIQTVETGGGPARHVVSEPFNASVPSWSRDGKWIYFTSERTGRSEIWRAPAQGGSAEQITRNGGYVALEGADGRTLYYTKTIDTTSELPLYAKPLAGGEEEQVLAGVRHRAFQVFGDGIYYITGRGPAGDEIRFYEFAKKRTRVVAPIEGQVGLGFSVSPDRNTFLFTKVVSEGSDLMLIENFR
jgi:Tol biopolymer transport system component